MKPPQYTFDVGRLAALDAYDILDTPPEEGFDDIALLTSHACGVPVALVSLVAGNRQWFKAAVGFDRPQTDLDSSVCAHALVEPDLLVIPDLSVDPRTRANPLVTGPPGIRFYAGAPLTTASGHVIGSLCAIDTVPRPEGLTGRQAELLRALARQVIGQLDLRRAVLDRDAALEDARSSEERFRLLFDSIDDGFCIIEMKFEAGRAVDYRFVEVNPAFERQTGLADAQGKWMRDLAPGHEQHWFDVYGEVARTGRPAKFENEARQLGDRWYEVRAVRVGTPGANLVGVLFADISERRVEELERIRAAEVQATIGRELSHRMKNLFAMVQALSTQTLRNALDRAAVAAFNRRIHALSAAHDLLLQRDWSAARIDVVVPTVIAPLASLQAFEISGPDLEIGPRATLALSLILHELATNALKYGALTCEPGRVSVVWRVEGDGEEARAILEWIESGGPPVAAPGKAGFGSRLIRMGLLGNGDAELSYAPKGLQARFSAPLAQLGKA